MRNILLHATVYGELATDGAPIRVRVMGHAFGLERLVVSLEGPLATLAMPVGVHPRTHEWIAEFTDAEALRRAGLGVGVQVRAVAADLDDEAGCFSSTTTVIESA